MKSKRGTEGTGAVRCSALLGRFTDAEGKWVSLEKDNGKIAAFYDDGSRAPLPPKLKFSLVDALNKVHFEKRNVLRGFVLLKNVLVTFTPVAHGSDRQNSAIRQENAEFFHKMIDVSKRPNDKSSPTGGQPVPDEGEKP